MHGGDGSTGVQGQNWPRSEKQFRFISEYPLSVLFPQAVGKGWDGASMEVLINYVLEMYPIEYPLEIDSILHSLGGDPKLTIYEDMGHGGPAQEAWEHEELYKWLLAQVRNQGAE